jgi:thiol-disulfide isomerase/thioredoxin
LSLEQGEIGAAPKIGGAKILSRCGMALIVICACSRLLAEGQDSAATQAEAESPAKRIALTEEQIVRGQAIRNLLVLGIDFARDHGEWPKLLSELTKGKVPPVTYLGPPTLPKDLDRRFPKELSEQLESQLKGFAAVCHESFADHPDGAWVGYADGHIEFVRDASALQSALAQFETASPLMQSMWEKLATSLEKRSKEAEPGVLDEARSGARNLIEGLVPQKLVLKLVDEEGQPANGARVGYHLQSADYDLPGGRSRLMTKIDDKSPHTVSDSDGRVELKYSWFFDPSESGARPTSLIAFHQDRGLIAVESLRPEEFAIPADGKAPTREVKLHRGIRVTGTVGCVGVPPEKSASLWAATYIQTFSGERPMIFMSKEQVFDFLLPPGDYYIQSYGEGVYGAFRFLRLTESSKSLQLHLDLPPDAVTSLAGKPAPELRQIKGWKNGGPTTLEGLRGKWVVLDFWGYWCGPCVGSMPELMELHDEFGDKGLVIIAVHDDSVESIEELDKHLEKTRQGLWKGRDLPFLVALDGGGELPISGTERSTKGATHAAYGVQHWPTTILIDPQGKVVGERDPRRPELRELLEKELKSAK